MRSWYSIDDCVRSWSGVCDLEELLVGYAVDVWVKVKLRKLDAIFYFWLQRKGHVGGSSQIQSQNGLD